ncbi:MAG: hypothetical protein IPK23_03280 [Rhizobiales bacterium]|nr:hypothetical protein [Hyphomicrobiales bacterium]
MRDKDKVAIFKGNVVVVQGDTTMRCRELEVHYEGSALGNDPRQNVPATKSQQKTESAQRIKRLIAIGGVIVTAKDQKAVGDKGTFEMATNIVILAGNVVVTQGQNVIHGDKLTVNLTDGTSKVDGVKQQGATPRVKGVFVPSSMDKKDKNKKTAIARRRKIAIGKLRIGPAFACLICLLPANGLPSPYSVRIRPWPGLKTRQKPVRFSL